MSVRAFIIIMGASELAIHILIRTEGRGETTQRRKMLAACARVPGLTTEPSNVFLRGNTAIRVKRPLQLNYENFITASLQYTYPGAGNIL